MAQRLGELRGGGTFEFLGNSSQGIEGFFTPLSGQGRTPVSLKDFSGTGRMANLIGRINVNARQVSAAGHAGPTVLYAKTPQFSVLQLADFARKGPLGRMGTEGTFSQIIFECSDGQVTIDATGVHP
jgi:hypothetical protein